MMSALAQYVCHDGHDVGNWTPVQSTLGFILFLMMWICIVPSMENINPSNIIWFLDT